MPKRRTAPTRWSMHPSCFVPLFLFLLIYALAPRLAFAEQKAPDTCVLPGEGSSPVHEKAVKGDPRFEEIEAQGFLDAASLYAGVAFEWMRRAAEHGNERAQE